MIIFNEHDRRPRTYGLISCAVDGNCVTVPVLEATYIIESVFQKFYDARGLYTERIPFDGRSDYDEFTIVGIPAGGIAAGAEVHKTPRTPC